MESTKIVSPIQVTPVEYELRATFYLHQNWNAPPSVNQLYVARPPNAGNFGETIAYDWPVYNVLDEKDPKRKLIARAGGTNVITNLQKEIRQNSLGLVFAQDSGYQDSTLQLMGTAIQDKGSQIPDITEWAIVGGTGEFTMAKGVVKMEKAAASNGQKFMEVKIYAIYTPLKI